MSDTRQVAVNWTGFLIAATNTALLFYICWGLFNRQFSIDIKDPVMLALGVLLAKHGDILGWAFGSSSEAKRSAETTSKAVDAIKTAQAANQPSEPAIPLSPGESVKVTADATSQQG